MRALENLPVANASVVPVIPRVGLHLTVMARAERVGRDWVLVEAHCPICAAAQSCQGFCRSELALFRRCLGPELQVERTEHLLAGARRCAYRISAAKEELATE